MHTHAHTQLHTHTHNMCTHTHLHTHTHTQHTGTTLAHTHHVNVSFECWSEGRSWQRKSDVIWKCVAECLSSLGDRAIAIHVECTAAVCRKSKLSRRLVDFEEISGYFDPLKLVILLPQILVKCCLMSSDVSWHIRDKLWPMPKHGSIILYVHRNLKAR